MIYEVAVTFEVEAESAKEAEEIIEGSKLRESGFAPVIKTGMIDSTKELEA